MKHILVTGATGKVGAHFVRHVLHSDLHKDVVICALCHNRVPERHSRLEIVKGNISDRDTVRQAMKGITHVIHCATCKETADNGSQATCAERVECPQSKLKLRTGQLGSTTVKRNSFSGGGRGLTVLDEGG